MQKTAISKVVLELTDKEKSAIDMFFECMFNQGYSTEDFEADYTEEYAIVTDFWEML